MKSRRSINAIKTMPAHRVTFDMMSSKLALPLKLVRTPDPPDIASPLPVAKISNENRSAMITAMTMRTL